MCEIEWADEGVVARSISQYEKPSQREVEQHNLTHMPFRPWCKHCVFGRAKNDPHLRDKGPKSSVPIVPWDYMYLKEDDKADFRPEIVNGDGLPILVGLDGEHKYIFASMIPQKGVCEYAIKRAANDVCKLLGD